MHVLQVSWKGIWMIYDDMGHIKICQKDNLLQNLRWFHQWKWMIWMGNKWRKAGSWCFNSWIHAGWCWLSRGFNNHFYIGFEPVDCSFTESSKWFPTAAGLEFFFFLIHHMANTMGGYIYLYIYIYLFIYIFSKDYKSITKQIRADPTIKTNH